MDDTTYFDELFEKAGYTIIRHEEIPDLDLRCPPMTLDLEDIPMPKISFPRLPEFTE